MKKYARRRPLNMGSVISDECSTTPVGCGLRRLCDFRCSWICAKNCLSRFTETPRRGSLLTLKTLRGAKRFRLRGYRTKEEARETRHRASRRSGYGLMLSPCQYFFGSVTAQIEKCRWQLPAPALPVSPT